MYICKQIHDGGVPWCESNATRWTLGLKMTNLKSPITDGKFREHSAPLYLLSVIGDLRFVILKNYREVDDYKEGRAQVPPLQILAKGERIFGYSRNENRKPLLAKAVSYCRRARRSHEGIHLLMTQLILSRLVIILS